MEKNGLTLAGGKTEVVYFCGRKRIRPLDIRVRGKEIPPKEEGRYLEEGVILDKRLSFNSHIEAKILTSLKSTEALKKLLPRTRGPSEQRRLQECDASHSFCMLLRVRPSVIKKKSYVPRMQTTQRIMGLGIRRAFRTVSACVALVISRTTPIDLLITEHIKRMEGRRGK